MECAVAMAFGGEKVSPDECSHSDFYDLGLKCPSCREIVKYVKGYNRIRNGKSEEVRACFSHLVETNKLQAELCDKRVRSLKKTDWEKTKAENRSQRLWILQKYFWRIFCENSPTLEGMSQKKIKEFLAAKYKLISAPSKYHNDKIWQEMYIPGFVEAINAEHVVKERLAVRTADFLERPLEKIASDSLREIVRKFREKANLQENDYAYKRLHTLVCEEVIDFLRTESGKPVLTLLTEFCFVMIVPRFYDGVFQLIPGLPRHYQIIHQMLDLLAMQIVLIHWSKEIGNRITLNKVARLPFSAP